MLKVCSLRTKIRSAHFSIIRAGFRPISDKKGMSHGKELVKFPNIYSLDENYKLINEKKEKKNCLVNLQTDVTNIFA